LFGACLIKILLLSRRSGSILRSIKVGVNKKRWQNENFC